MNPRDSANLTIAPLPAAPVRVLHLIHTMAYGGIETALINWLRGFDPHRCVATLACFANPGGTERPFVEAAQRAGLAVETISWGRRKPLLRAARELAALARRHDAQIIHSHGWYADYVTVLAARLAPVKTITTLYVWHDFDWKRNVLQFIEKYAIRAFDRISAHCEATRDATIARGFRPEDIATLVCGFETHPVSLSPEERARERALHGVAEGEAVLINAARFYPEKAHGFLLRCFSLILAERPNTRLWIAGVGPLEAQTRALARELSIDHRVTFLGFVPDLARAMATADIQVHPAEIEGVPLSICEGMAAGLPIVASRVGGLPEVITHDERGLLVPRGDTQAFVAAVKTLLDDPQAAKRMGENARRFIREDYSLSRAVRRVEDTYIEMLKACV